MKIDFSLVCFFFMKETIRTLFLNFSDLHPLLPTIARKLEVVTISIFLLTIFNLRISAYLASQNLVKLLESTEHNPRIEYEPVPSILWPYGYGLQGKCM